MNITLFLCGVSMTAFGFCGVFFFKFWRASRDSFFLCFATACWLLGVERIGALFVTSMLDPSPASADDSSSLVYLIRLSAFVMITYAVIKKNQSGP